VTDSTVFPAVSKVPVSSRQRKSKNQGESGISKLER